jgi:hypothetical protein
MLWNGKVSSVPLLDGSQDLSNDMVYVKLLKRERLSAIHAATVMLYIELKKFVHERNLNPK